MDTKEKFVFRGLFVITWIGMLPILAIGVGISFVIGGLKAMPKTIGSIKREVTRQYWMNEEGV